MTSAQLTSLAVLCLSVCGACLPACPPVVSVACRRGGRPQVARDYSSLPWPAPFGGGPVRLDLLDDDGILLLDPIDLSLPSGYNGYNTIEGPAAAIDTREPTSRAAVVSHPSTACLWPVLDVYGSRYSRCCMRTTDIRALWSVCLTWLCVSVCPCQARRCRRGRRA